MKKEIVLFGKNAGTRALQIAYQLALGEFWFEFTPLGYQEFAIAFRDEPGPLLQVLANAGQKDWRIENREKI